MPLSVFQFLEIPLFSEKKVQKESSIRKTPHTEVEDFLMLLFDLDQPYKIVIDKFVIIHDQKMKMIFHTF